MPNWLILILVLAASTLVGPVVIYLDAKGKGDPRAGERFAASWKSYVSYLGAFATFGIVVAFLAWLAR